MTSATAVPGSRTRVLVVEDDSALRSLLRDFLELLGCAVQLAANGREALEHLQQVRPDLVLLDFDDADHGRAGLRHGGPA